jgi:hypothetical protein
MTPLHVAARSATPATIRLLLSHGADRAAETKVCHLTLVKLLCALLFLVTGAVLLFAVCSRQRGTTPRDVARAAGRVDICNVLLDE